MRTHLLPVTILALLAIAAAAAPRALAQDDAEPQSYTVSGLVEDEKGNPLKGVRVEGSTHHAELDHRTRTHDIATTDGAGRFSLELASGKGYVHVWYEAWGANDHREIQVDDANVTDLTFTLVSPPPKTAVVEGRVLDEAGNPVEGADVRLQQGCCYAMEVAAEEPAKPEPATGNESDARATSTASPAVVRPGPACCYDRSQTTTTDADGAFRFETYGGPRELVVDAKGYAQTREAFTAHENDTVRVDVALEKIPPANAQLTGRIVDAETGLPIAGASINFQNLEWGRYAWDHAADDGTFSFRTIPGWVQVEVLLHDRGYGLHGSDDAVSSEGAADGVEPPATPKRSYYTYTQALDLQEGETELEIRLQPRAAPTVVLTGYVLDPDAQEGISGAQIRVRNEDTGQWGHATTDETGSYRLLVAPGHYTAHGWARGHLSTGASFVIAEGEAAKRFDLPMPKGERKWAPCQENEDCGGRGEIMYAEAAAVPAESGSGSPPAPRPVATPTPPTPSREAAAGGGSDGEDTALMTGRAATQDEGTNAAAYQGTGGGLPPYDPENAGSTDVSSATREEGPDGTNPVPAPAVVGILALAGLAALARRRGRV